MSIYYSVNYAGIFDGGLIAKNDILAYIICKSNILVLLNSDIDIITYQHTGKIKCPKLYAT